jgi:hypothetical protein
MLENQQPNTVDPAKGRTLRPIASESRGQSRRTINRYSADNDWSRWKTYALIRDGKLKAERIGGRLYITAESAKAFDDAANSGMLANAGK